jgi:hypothetical protein
VKTLKEYIDLQPLTGASDEQIIRSYFIDNDMEEEGMELAHDLAEAKIKKMREKVSRIDEWAYTLPSDYLYENYPVKTATMLHRIELDYLVNGAVTGSRLKWAKENLPSIEEPQLYFQPCAWWLKEHGIKFKGDANET